MSKVISKIVVPDSSELTGYALYNVKDANAIPASEKGAASGVATLDNTGKIPSSQIPSGIVSQLSDWNQTDSTAGDYIKNKPTIPSVGNAEIEILKNGTKVGSFTTNQSGSKVTMNITVPTGTAANKDVPTSGNASTSQVVMGNDSRLTDSRNAKDVYSWAKASSKPTYTASEVGAIPTSAKGAASGVATLDSAGKVPTSQLPSYVDDVLEYETRSAFPTTGEGGKIYVDKSTNTTWRWSGSAYTQIKGDLVIGTTSGTAADGGTASAHYSNTSNPHSVTKSQVGLGKVVNTGDSATPVSGGTTKFTTGGAYTELNKKVDKVEGKGLSANDYTTNEKNKLAGIAAGAEVNVQSDWNATSGDAFIKNKPTIPAAAANGTYTVKTLVGSTTTNVSDFTANQSSADDVTFVQGSNVTITPDATNRKITIAATDTKYTAATAAPGKVASSSKQGSSTNYARQDHTHGIALATGDANGQVKIAGTNVSVKGLGSAAYTASSAYAVSQQLASDANLNNIKTVGFYHAGGGNTITNKPSGVEHFGMEVIHYASGDYYVQIVYNKSNSWRRRCDNNTWGSWVQDKLTDTTYSSKSAASGGTDVSLVTTGEKYTWNSKTSNTGTVTSVAVKMNGATKGTVTTSGTIDLGTVLTSHQDISGKADKSATVSSVAYNTTSKKITKTINGTTSDVVTAAKIVTDGGGIKDISGKVDKTTTVNGHALSGNISVTKSDVGLGNVGNFKAVSTAASQGLSTTEKSNARANIGAGTSSFSGSYNDLSNKPTIPTVSQTTGQSTTAVMSQKAVSDLVPAQASSSNQLADKKFVNSSITTATATYQGSYNLVSDLGLTISASHGQIEQALNTHATGADKNDYSFVQIPTSNSTPTEIASVERYKHNGTTWSYEYAINNSGFTAAQWAAVNSNITSGLVAKLNQLSGNTQNSIANLFGMDSSGNFQNISTSNLASVLSQQLYNLRLEYNQNRDIRSDVPAGYYGILISGECKASGMLRSIVLWFPFKGTEGQYGFYYNINEQGWNTVVPY